MSATLNTGHEFSVTANGVRRVPRPRSVVCAHCRQEFQTKASRKRFCSDACIRLARSTSRIDETKWLPKGRWIPTKEHSIKRDGYLGMPLHPLERETMRWVEFGKDAIAIGQIMGVSQACVNNRIHRVMAKLGAANRTHAVALILKAEMRAELAGIRGALV